MPPPPRRRAGAESLPLDRRQSLEALICGHFGVDGPPSAAEPGFLATFGKADHGALGHGRNAGAATSPKVVAALAHVTLTEVACRGAGARSRNLADVWVKSCSAAEDAAMTPSSCEAPTYSESGLRGWLTYSPPMPAGATLSSGRICTEARMAGARAAPWKAKTEGHSASIARQSGRHHGLCDNLQTVFYAEASAPGSTHRQTLLE